MAATIKPIEAKSVHQIQAGQVIVDLCSVVKELVENALDAQATTIEVRFKNYGLDSIEVQDNGTGIAEADYGNLAKKHRTSKLSTYDDLSSLQTFGFRGEALSSLCAVSTFTIHTAQAHEAPKGKRLEFETNGTLKSTNLIATPKGTTAIVENLFFKLPVRQKELSKHIKREYGKVLGILHAYACISTMVKFTVKNAASKGRSSVVFSTKGNATSRENIANVYGAKVLSQLIELDMQLDFPSTFTQPRNDTDLPSKVTVVGHISKPVFGEGRQTPDRQMFFVNGRPCGLPQISKAINEVYKSYNVSQSPFIFADLRMDTNSYDVNISPDKRTIFLHDASALTEGLKSALTDRFDKADQTVPQTLRTTSKLPKFKPLTLNHTLSEGSEEPEPEAETPTRSPLPETGMTEHIEEHDHDHDDLDETSPPSLLKSYFGAVTTTRGDLLRETSKPEAEKRRGTTARQTETLVQAIGKKVHPQNEADEYDDLRELSAISEQRQSSEEAESTNIHVLDFNARMNEQMEHHAATTRIVSNRQLPSPNRNASTTEEKGVVPNAFDRMRPRRLSPELATITIGDKVITRMIGTPKADRSDGRAPSTTSQKPVSLFSQSLRKFDVDHADENTVMHPDNKSERISRHQSTSGESCSDTVESDVDVSESKVVRQSSELKQAETLKIDFDNHSGSTRGIYDEAIEKAREENRVKELIQRAEESNVRSNKEQRRDMRILKGGVPKDSTVNLLAVLDTQLDHLIQQSKTLRQRKLDQLIRATQPDSSGVMDTTEEERLSLTISKDDFARMHIAGQFNLGFIIALRHQREHKKTRQKDELFIIDQHASDEKYNFERLQAETVVGNQRLVHPVMLDLTAMEEEVVLENTLALQQNGFVIEADLSGELSVGQRCQLMSLPLSKETTLGIRDLEELIHLLSETHMSTNTQSIPRPTKIRKMFAMRACRSSIMIGKTLSKRQMKTVLDHMGMIDKPWNCPHGRPTMRHLISLDDLDSQLWNEGDGVVSDDTVARTSYAANVWKQYLDI